MSVDIESRVKRANLITRDEQLEQLFGDETSNRFLLEILAKKEGRMTDIRPDQQTTSEKVPTEGTTSETPRLRLGVALAAFAVVIAAGIGFVLVRDSNTAASSSPVEVGESYINAADEWDSEAALALLAPGAVMTSGLAESPTDIPALFDFYRANDWRWMVSECQQTNVGEPAEVKCTLTHQNAWMRALGVDPRPGGSYEFVITDGEIEEVGPGFIPFPEWDRFIGWLATNHGTDLLVLVPDGCCTPSLTPEAIVLWEQYTKEFVAEQDGS